MTYKRPVSVLVVIHTPALEVLLLERAAHPGYWQSVTGSQEEGESLEDTACRELFEETGIRADAGRLQRWPLANRFEILPLWRHRYAPGVTHNLEHVFSICVPDGTAVTIAPDEHRAYRWLPWREAAAECFSWTNQDAVLMLPLRTARAA
ncbi:dihydroneopterin triphosphate diphosphatase [Uliginosibacterium sp. sgz301328]|uniref:dihydroneopterin triphosphate diphosphatase n=1 Tax=Uliginosibacterium sp. sgz301328 TaxID=3243764 RepID=UPI00359EF30C